MMTMTVQIPNNQAGWFEQMVSAMGWIFTKSTTDDTTTSPKTVYENDVDELLSLFKTDKIGQEEISKECECVREEIYAAR